MGDVIIVKFGMPEQKLIAEDSPPSRLKDEVPRRIGEGAPLPPSKKGGLPFDVDDLLAAIPEEIKKTLFKDSKFLPKTVISMIMNTPFSSHTFEASRDLVRTYTEDEVRGWIMAAQEYPQKILDDPAFYRAVAIRAEKLGFIFVNI